MMSRVNFFVAPIVAVMVFVFVLFADDFQSSGVSSGSNPPSSCTASYAGIQWMDTDTGVLYVCDTSTSRNKWLSASEFHLIGSGDSTSCKDGDPSSDPQCTQTIGIVSANDMGYQLERDATIVGGGFHADSSCVNGSGVDLEVANGENASVAYLADILTGCIDANGCTATGLNIDVSGGDMIRARLDNNCATGNNNVDDWGSSITIRWHHP